MNKKNPDGTWYDENGTLWRMGETVPITVTQKDDPAQFLLNDGYESTPVIYKRSCYICEDPEFAQMGLPLCRKCPACGGHIAADDSVCDECGLDDLAFWQVVSDQSLSDYDLRFCFSTGYPDYEQRLPSIKQLFVAIKAFRSNRDE